MSKDEVIEMNEAHCHVEMLFPLCWRSNSMMASPSFVFGGGLFVSDLFYLSYAANG